MLIAIAPHSLDVSEGYSVGRAKTPNEFAKSKGIVGSVDSKHGYLHLLDSVRFLHFVHKVYDRSSGERFQPPKAAVLHWEGWDPKFLVRVVFSVSLPFA
jgi:hypothetical protein